MHKFSLHLNKQLFLCFLLAILNVQWLAGQSATYDSAFNLTGILYSNTNEFIAVQADQKLLCAGQTNLQRFDINGSPDSGFGINGSVESALGSNGEYILGVAQQANGKINLEGVAGGRAVLVQYLTDGRPDSNFHHTGILTLDPLPVNAGIAAVTRQPDGKIIVAGNFYDTTLTTVPSFFAARYNVDGTTDKSFGLHGVTYTSFSLPATANAVAVQPDGKILITGRIETRDFAGILIDSMAVSRYNADGSLDPGFNDTGTLTMLFPDSNYDAGAEGKALLLLPDGKIVIACNAYHGHNHGEWVWGSFVLLRLTQNGIPDPSFNGGTMRTASGSRPIEIKLAYQSDHKIIFACTSSNWEFQYQSHILVSRINDDGSADPTFGQDGSEELDYGDPFSYKSLRGLALGHNRIYLSGAEEFYSFNRGVFAIEHKGIPFNPVIQDVCVANPVITIASDLQGTSYQWEVSNNNNSFSSVINSDHYSGASSATLSLHNVPVSWSGYQYRCIVGGSMSNTTTIIFLDAQEDEWTGAISDAWEDPGNWLCGSIPGTGSKVIIKTGNVIIHSNASIADLHIVNGASVTVANGYSLGVAAKETF